MDNQLCKNKKKLSTEFDCFYQQIFCMPSKEQIGLHKKAIRRSLEPTHDGHDGENEESNNKNCKCLMYTPSVLWCTF